MKKILILIVAIAFLKTITRVDSTAHRNSASMNFVSETSYKVEPEFTSLDGNLFLAINLNEELNLEDGDVVQFDFGGRDKLVSFHINDSNQDIIDKGDAELFVIVHHDLALMLKDQKLKRLNISHKSKNITVPVNEYWAPSQKLVTL